MGVGGRNVESVRLRPDTTQVHEKRAKAPDHSLILKNKPTQGLEPRTSASRNSHVRLSITVKAYWIH